MDVLVIVLASVIVTAAWIAFWGLRLWRKVKALWSAVEELLGVADELQRITASVDVPAVRP